MQHEVPLPTWQNGTPSFFQCTHASVEKRRIAYTKEVGAKRIGFRRKSRLQLRGRPILRNSRAPCARQVFAIARIR
jgi:hypothetical protein